MKQKLINHCWQVLTKLPIYDAKEASDTNFSLFPILLYLSKLGGADRPAEIADWVKFRFAELKSLLNLEWKKSPHEVTWKRILENVIEALEVEKLFGEYLLSMSEDEKQL